MQSLTIKFRLGFMSCCFFVKISYTNFSWTFVTPCMNIHGIVERKVIFPKRSSEKLLTQLKQYKTHVTLPSAQFTSQNSDQNFFIETGMKVGKSYHDDDSRNFVYFYIKMDTFHSVTAQCVHRMFGMVIASQQNIS